MAGWPASKPPESFHNDAPNTRYFPLTQFSDGIMAFNHAWWQRGLPDRVRGHDSVAPWR